MKLATVTAGEAAELEAIEAAIVKVAEKIALISSAALKESSASLSEGTNGTSSPYQSAVTLAESTRRVKSRR